MKLMIASDIHGSDYYCKKLISAFEKESAEKLLILGDILYHGPRNDLPNEYAPKGVIERLNAIKERILAVRGNCDTEVDQMVLSFPIMADYAVVVEGGKSLYLTHGHKYNKQNPLPLPMGSVVLYGHTHVPDYSVINGITYINPGSVSIPKESSNHGYVIIENNIVEYKTLSGATYRTEKLK